MQKLCLYSLLLVRLCNSVLFSVLYANYSSPAPVTALVSTLRIQTKYKVHWYGNPVLMVLN